MVPLYLSEVPLPTFSPFLSAILARRTEVARDQVELVVVVPPSVRAAHARPGQFVKVRVLGEDGAPHEGIFAMANAPLEPVGDGPALRFLLRTHNPEGGEAASRLATMPEGASFEISEPAGSGFELTRARDRMLCFVATGTAIAPIRAALEAALAAPIGARSLSLDFGLRGPEHMPIQRDLERYAERGVVVRVHYSVPREDGTVQGVRAHDALLARLAENDVRQVLVIAVGQPAMVKELRARVVELGGAAEDVVSNY